MMWRTAATIVATVLVAVLSTGVGGAGATVVYNNGLPDTTNGYSIHGSNSTADDFMLTSPAVITSVGFYFQNYQGITGWNGIVDYAIYADSGGAPGLALAYGTAQNVVAVDSGLPWCCGGNA